MKTKTRLTLLAFAALAVPYATAQLGGSLTPPPGAPAPGMKTLDQVEARIPLVEGAPGVFVEPLAGTIVILQPGSYYLTGNRVIPAIASADGIINADDVTLDLNGFNLISTESNSDAAVKVFDRKGVTIRNGSITGGTIYTNGTFVKKGWKSQGLRI